MRVDDVKVGWSADTLHEFVGCLEGMFGEAELEITATDFVNCGIKHISTSGSCLLEQADYIAALKPIANSSITGCSADEKSPEPLSKRFLCLPTALGYTPDPRGLARVRCGAAAGCP
jgi:hypothetical protein